MGKVVSSIAIGIGLVGLAFITGGASIGPTLAFTSAGTVATASIATALTTTFLGSALLAVGAGAILSGVASAFVSKPSAAQLGRLQLSFNPGASRKIVFGTTAMATDLIYAEPSGTDQLDLNYVIVLAAHKVTSVDSIYLDDKLFWTAAGGLQGDFAGFGGVAVREEGSAANALNVGTGSVWTSANCRLTGCAYIYVQLYRKGSNKKSESPFAGGVTTSWKIVGKGIPVYDPRRDSTRGGSGSHRADNQATWQFADGATELGQNPALQALTFLLGWRIGSQVSVGVGYPVDRIDYADWIAAANVCDESVSLSSGSHRRYETAGLFSDEDSPRDVLASLLIHMNAELRDVNGKLGVRVATYDFSGTLPAFTADDVLGAYSWSGFSALTETFDVVRGNYTDPTTASLYQEAAYTQEATGSSDIPGRRVLNLDLPLCQDPIRAQRIARQVLRRELFRSTFTADFGPRMWAYKVGDVINFSFPLLGISNIPFRIVSQSVKVIADEEGAQAFCPTTLQVEDASIYIWTSTDGVNPPGAVAPVSLSYLNQPLIRSLREAATTGENLLINPGLSGDALDWNFAFGGARVVGTSTDPSPAFIRVGTFTGGRSFFTGRYQVGGSTRLYLSWQSRRSSGATITFCNVGFYFYDRAGTYISQAQANATPAGTGWGQNSFQFNVPSNAYTWQIQVDTSNPSGDFDFADWRASTVQRGADATSVNWAAGIQNGGTILQAGGTPVLAAAQSFELLVTDGQVLTWALARTPGYNFDISNLPALSAGETYSLRLDNLTASGATVRLKTRTSGGTPATLTSGTGVVITSGAEYQSSKNDSRDARDGIYAFRVQGQFDRVFTSNNGGAGGGGGDNVREP
jgi:hypothetical protein